MGISNPYYFAWLRAALHRFETTTGHLAAIRASRSEPVVWSLGGQQLDPPHEYLLDRLGRGQTRIEFFDKFATLPGVHVQDINELNRLPSDGCDVLTLLRASMFINDPQAFLAQAHRVVRSRGLVLIDWLHGLSDAPVLDLRGDPEYGGQRTPFLTTYSDGNLIAEFSTEFLRFVRHVNRPPSWANVEAPGRRVPALQRVRRMLGAGPRNNLTLETYPGALRAELQRAGKHLIEPALLETFFKVVFRDARYFYRQVRKFNLYVLTILEPR